MGQFKTFMNTNPVLSESSWSRIVHHVESDDDFAVISAFRIFDKHNELVSHEENLKKHEELEKRIRELGYGFIEQASGYTYTSKKRNITSKLMEEMSFFIPKIDYDTAMGLGVEFDQESILFKGDKTNGFVLVYCRDGEDDDGNKYKKGDIGLRFKMKKTKEKKDDREITKGQITFDPAVLKYAYSSLIKANNVQRYAKDKKTGEIKNRYAFVVESICEGIIPSRTSAMMRRNYVTWRDIITGERQPQ